MTARTIISSKAFVQIWFCLSLLDLYQTEVTRRQESEVALS